MGRVTARSTGAVAGEAGPERAGAPWLPAGVQFTVGDDVLLDIGAHALPVELAALSAVLGWAPSEPATSAPLLPTTQTPRIA